MKAVATDLPAPQIGMLFWVAAGAIKYASFSGGIVMFRDQALTRNARPPLRALERKGLIKMPPQRRSGLVTITPAGRKALERVDTTGKVGIVMEDGVAHPAVAS